MVNGSGEGHQLWIQAVQAQTPLLITSTETLSKSLYVSVPKCPRNTVGMALPPTSWSFCDNEVVHTYVKCVEQRSIPNCCCYYKVPQLNT